jgi:hypothetical protein
MVASWFCNYWSKILHQELRRYLFIGLHIAGCSASFNRQAYRFGGTHQRFARLNLTVADGNDRSVPAEGISLLRTYAFVKRNFFSTRSQTLRPKGRNCALW